ncbi:MAG: transglycosylase domain-containing protein [Dehalococcoidia bacterium]
MARLFKRRRYERLRNGNGGRRRIRGWMLVPIILFGVMLVGTMAMSVAGFIVYRVYANGMPPVEQLLSQNAGGAQIYDRNGNLLYTFSDDLSGLRSPVPLSEVSPYLIKATVDTEDSSFYSNPGINIKGLLRAAYENFLPGNLNFLQGTGGSSITQQFVKNVYIPEADRSKRSISRKIKETVYAMELTKRYSKDQILEWYLNQIPYGGVYNGIEAASEGYLGKKASDLTLGEAALLAGIPACPSCYDPLTNPDAAAKRRDQVLVLMEEKGDITPEEGWNAAQEPLDIVQHRFTIDAAHWVLSYIGPELERMFGHEAVYRQGLKVTTTLDLNLQTEAEADVENWVSQYEDEYNAHNGALVAMDPRTGEILAYVGSRDYFRDDIQGANDMAQALNSPGSTLKPFTYLTAFMKLGWGPGTMVLDTPTCYNEDNGTQFCPENPEGNYQGPVTIRQALGNSLNIPAFKVIQMAGVNDVIDTARKMGITGLDGSYGPSFTIGGTDVKLVDVVYAYSVFATGGIMRGVPTTLTLPPGYRDLDPVSILNVEDSQGNVIWNADDQRTDEQIIPSQYAYLITNILSDPQAECLTFGCGGLTVPGQSAAVKTGTSEPYANSKAIGDTWAFGYTPDLVVGVWAGNADHTSMGNILSTTIAFPAMRDFMEAALAGKPASTFDKPDGVADATVCVPSSKLPTPYCGKTSEDLFVTDALTEKDDWWQPTKIDIRTGLLATELTPPQFVEERGYLVVPPEVQGFERDQALEWASLLGGAAPSEGTNPADIPVAITSPSAGARVSGNVTVTGRASSADFQSYKLEYGVGASPTEWAMIYQSNTAVNDSTLAVWNTTGFPAGQYTLRLTLTDAKRGDLVTTTTITLGQGQAAARTPTPATGRPPPPATPTTWP